MNSFKIKCFPTLICLSFLLLNFNFSIAQEGKFHELSMICKDGKERPYILYEPENLNSGANRPLLIFLHGSISSPSLKNNPLEYMQKSKLISLADEGGFYLMFSYGQKDATWFDETGVSMVLDEIEYLKKNYNIDADKIFLSGFSDGGSGVFYMAMTNPSLFAGFIALNGHLRITTKLGTSQVYPENLNQKPLYIINTKSDLLYPAREIPPIINELKEYDNHIIYNELEGNHEMSYLEDETPEILKFIRENTRNFAEHLSWETSDLTSNKVDWLSINQIDTTFAKAQWHQDYSLDLFNDKADFGIEYDYSYQGKGLKIAGFKNDSAVAKKMRMQIGDVVMMMENDSIKNAYSPYYYLAEKRAGDDTFVTILRNEKQITFNGKFNPGGYYELYNHQKKSGKIQAWIDDNTLYVNTSRVSNFSIDFEKIPKKYKLKKMILNDSKIRIRTKGIQSFSVEL